MSLNTGVKSDKFIDQCLLTIIEYLYNMKNNMSLPNLPVEIFNSLDLVKTKLESELEDYYKNTLHDGSLLA
jgi:hypothetical protein